MVSFVFLIIDNMDFLLLVDWLCASLLICHAILVMEKITKYALTETSAFEIFGHCNCVGCGRICTSKVLNSSIILGRLF